MKRSGPPKNANMPSQDDQFSWNTVPRQSESRSAAYYHETSHDDGPYRDPGGRDAGYSETFPNYPESRLSTHQGDGWPLYKDEGQEFLESQSQPYREGSSLTERTSDNPSLPKKPPKGILRNKIINNPEVGSMNPNQVEKNHPGNFDRNFREDQFNKRQQSEVSDEQYLEARDPRLLLHNPSSRQGFNQQRETDRSLPYTGRAQFDSPQMGQSFSYRESDDVPSGKRISDSRFYESSFTERQQVTGSRNTGQNYTKSTVPNTSQYSRDRFREEDIHTSIYNRKNLGTQMDAVEYRSLESKTSLAARENVSDDAGLTEDDSLREMEEREFYTGRMTESCTVQSDGRARYLATNSYKSGLDIQNMLNIAEMDMLPKRDERSVPVRDGDHEARMKSPAPRLIARDEEAKYLVENRYKLLYGDQFDDAERKRLQRLEEARFSSRQDQLEERLKIVSSGIVSQDDRDRFLLQDRYKEDFCDQVGLTEREKMHMLEERRLVIEQAENAEQKHSSPDLMSRNEHSPFSIEYRSRHVHDKDSSVVDSENIVKSASFLQPVESLEDRIQKFEKELKKHSLTTKKQSGSPTHLSPDRLLGKRRQASVEREDKQHDSRLSRSRQRNPRWRDDRGDLDRRRISRERLSPEDTGRHRKTSVHTDRRLSRDKHISVNTERMRSKDELHREKSPINTRSDRYEKDKWRRSRSERSRSPVSIRSSRFDQRRERSLHERSRFDDDRRNREVERAVTETTEGSYERKDNNKSTRRYSPTYHDHDTDRGYSGKANVRHKENVKMPSEFNQRSIEDIVNKACSGSINMASIGTTYTLPVNCFQLQPPKVESGTMIKLPELTRNEDNLLLDAQQFVAISLVPVINLASLFITDTFVIEKATVYTIDALALLGQAFHELIHCREAFLAGSVSSDNMYDHKGTGGVKSRFEKMFPKGNNSGQAVDVYIANMVNLACSKWGEIESIQTTYMSKSNCKNVLFPKINVIKIGFVSDIVKRRDTRLQCILKNLSLGMSPLIECALSMHSNVLDVQKVSSLITDSLMLLGHTMYKLSLLRCRLLRSNLPAEFNRQKRAVFTNGLFDETAPDDDEAALDILEIVDDKKDEEAKLEVSDNLINLFCE